MSNTSVTMSNTSMTMTGIQSTTIIQPPSDDNNTMTQTLGRRKKKGGMEEGRKHVKDADAVDDHDEDEDARGARRQEMERKGRIRKKKKKILGLDEGEGEEETRKSDEEEEEGNYDEEEEGKDEENSSGHTVTGSSTVVCLLRPSRRRYKEEDEEKECHSVFHSSQEGVGRRGSQEEKDGGKIFPSFSPHSYGDHHSMQHHHHNNHEHHSHSPHIHPTDAGRGGGEGRGEGEGGGGGGEGMEIGREAIGRPGHFHFHPTSSSASASSFQQKDDEQSFHSMEKGRREEEAYGREEERKIREDERKMYERGKKNQESFCVNKSGSSALPGPLHPDGRSYPSFYSYPPGFDSSLPPSSSSLPPLSSSLPPFSSSTLLQQQQQPYQFEQQQIQHPLMSRELNHLHQDQHQQYQLRHQYQICEDEGKKRREEKRVESGTGRESMDEEHQRMDDEKVEGGRREGKIHGAGEQIGMERRKSATGSMQHQQYSQVESLPPSSMYPSSSGGGGTIPSSSTLQGGVLHRLSSHSTTTTSSSYRTAESNFSRKQMEGNPKEETQVDSEMEGPEIEHVGPRTERSERNEREGERRSGREGERRDERGEERMEKEGKRDGGNIRKKHSGCTSSSYSNKGESSKKNDKRGDGGRRRRSLSAGGLCGQTSEVSYTSLSSSRDFTSCATPGMESTHSGLVLTTNTVTTALPTSGTTPAPSGRVSGDRSAGGGQQHHGRHGHHHHSHQCHGRTSSQRSGTGSHRALYQYHENCTSCSTQCSSSYSESVISNKTFSQVEVTIPKEVPVEKSSVHENVPTTTVSTSGFCNPCAPRRARFQEDETEGGGRGGGKEKSDENETRLPRNDPDNESINFCCSSFYGLERSCNHYWYDYDDPGYNHRRASIKTSEFSHMPFKSFSHVYKERIDPPSGSEKRKSPDGGKAREKLPLE